MKLGLGWTAISAGTALALGAAAASAQDIRNLDEEASDVRIYTGEVTTAPVVFSYTIPPQTSLTVDVKPTPGSQLDPMISVTDAATGEVLAEDDDGGDGVASRTRIYSETGQVVEIAVTAFGFLSDDESYGGFQLELRESRGRSADIAEIAFGDSVDGVFDQSGESLFTISGEEGQLLQVAMIARSEALDPMLEIYPGPGMTGEPLVSDDDGGNDLNSLLRFVLPETGIYTIRATSFDSASGGEFTLRVAEAGFAEIQPPRQSIGLGERLSGRIGQGYESGSLDPADIVYELTPEAIAAIRSGRGEVTVNMTTPLFEDEDFPSGVDAYLELGFETPLGYASVLSDDDGGEEFNSRIAVDLSPLAREADWLERLRIRASSFADGGAFEIELVEGMQEVEASFDDFEEITPAPPIRVEPGD